MGPSLRISSLVYRKISRPINRGESSEEISRQSQKLTLTSLSRLRPANAPPLPHLSHTPAPGLQLRLPKHSGHRRRLGPCSYGHFDRTKVSVRLDPNLSFHLLEGMQVDRSKRDYGKYTDLII